jgi:hypothetical protein
MFTASNLENNEGKENVHRICILRKIHLCMQIFGPYIKCSHLNILCL